jgi:hypothetical protein
MESSGASGTCGYQWTTGSGPDDPVDTGVHKCVRTSHGREEHVCACTAVAPAAAG